MINLLHVCECFGPKMVAILIVVIQHYEECEVIYEMIIAYLIMKNETIKLYKNSLNNKYVEK